MLPDRLDKEKLYIQLTNIFIAKIRSGEWRPGRQIPTEEDLCKSLGVSKITVRRAIDNLVFEGFLEKLQGKGTFVRQRVVHDGISMKTTLFEGVFLPGGGRENIKVVENKVVQGIPDDVIRRMGPVIDKDMYFLSRLKIAEGVPVLLNEIFIPLRVCPLLKEWEPDGASVFEFLREHADSKITKVFQTVEVGKPEESTARLLNARAAGACMIIHRLFHSAGDATLAYSKTTARSDRFKLETEYERVG